MRIDTVTPRRDTVSDWSHREILKRALVHLHAIQLRRERYAEECDRYRREGYRPHYCFHGTNLWVDWDNICGGCEDPRDDREIALDTAWAEHRVSVERAEAACAFMRLNPPVGDSAAAIWAWVGDPMREPLF